MRYFEPVWISFISTLNSFSIHWWSLPEPNYYISDFLILSFLLHLLPGNLLQSRALPSFCLLSINLQIFINSISITIILCVCALWPSGSLLKPIPVSFWMNPYSLGSPLLSGLRCSRIMWFFLCRRLGMNCFPRSSGSLCGDDI